MTKRAKRKALEREKELQQKKEEEEKKKANAPKPSFDFLKNPLKVSIAEGDLFSDVSFSSMGLSETLVTHLTGSATSSILFSLTLTLTFINIKEHMKISKPTHVQAATVTQLLQKRDV